MKAISAKISKQVISTMCLVLLIVLIQARPSVQKSVDANRKTIWQTDAKSSVEISEGEQEGHRNLRIENHSYFSARDVVLSQTIVWRIGGWEGNRPELETTAFRITPNGTKVDVWSIKEEADIGRLERDNSYYPGFYHTIWYGCCDASPNNRLYNPDTGNLIMEYCRDLLGVEMGNPPEVSRLIGYKPVASKRTNYWENDNHYLGTLTYSSPNEILHRIIIRGTTADYEDKFGYYGLADISFEAGVKNIEILDKGYYNNDLIYPIFRILGPFNATNPRNFSNFRIKLLFHSGIMIEIPVVQDDFVIDPTTFKDFEIIKVGTK